MAYQNLSSLTGSPNLLSTVGGNQSQAISATTSMGTKAKSPSQNLTPLSNTLSSSQTAPGTPNQTLVQQDLANAKSKSVTQPTQASQVTPGSTITDTSGNTGTALFDPKTGNPYPPTGGSSTGNPIPTQPSGLFGQATSALYNTSSQPSTQYTNLTSAAQNAYQTAGNTNQVIGQNEANDLHNPNYSLDTGVGLAGLIQQNYGLQGQNDLTQAQGLTSLANTANTQQGLQQSGLAATASAAAPVSQFGVLTNPTTGQAISPDGGLNAAVQGGQIQGAQNAAATNAATQGTAAITASNSVYQSAVSNLANVQNMAQNIQSFGTQLLGNMDQLGIRTNSTLANQTLNALQSQFSSPQYAQFNANIQGLQARVSALLGTGEIPTSATAGAQAIINGNITPAAMESTLNQINSEASAIVQNQASIATSAFKNIQSSGSQSSGSTASTSGFGWNG